MPIDTLNGLSAIFHDKSTVCAALGQSVIIYIYINVSYRNAIEHVLSKSFWDLKSNPLFLPGMQKHKPHIPTQHN